MCKVSVSCIIHICPLIPVVKKHNARDICDIYKVLLFMSQDVFVI
jgi:hypothetical protein